jgi:hypothetical protein
VRSRLAAEPKLANRRYKPPDSDALPPALRVVAAAKEVSHPDTPGSWLKGAHVTEALSNSQVSGISSRYLRRAPLIARTAS